MKADPWMGSGFVDLDAPFHRFPRPRAGPSFRFFAVPVKVAGMGTFPVRAFAIRSLGSSAAGSPP
jgi:hypothetical protein